jgi:hypothetical protein
MNAWEGINWIYPAESKTHWRIVINTVTVLRVPHKARDILMR